MEAVAGARRVILVEGPVDYLVGRGWGLPVVALGGQGLAAADLAGLRAATDIALLLDADDGRPGRGGAAAGAAGPAGARRPTAGAGQGPGRPGAPARRPGAPSTALGP